MKSGSNPRPADDEDFTSAAESLLGIDLSSSGLSGAPIDLDDADLFGEPDVVEPQPAEPPAAAVDETQEFRAVSAAAPLMDDDDFGDFGAGLVADEIPPRGDEQRPAPRSQPKPASRPVERPAPRSEERKPPRSEERPAPRAEQRPEENEEPAAAAAPAPRKDDAYWDALEGWDWSDEGTGSSKSAAKEDAPPPRGRSGDRSRGRSRGDSQSRRSSERERAPERPAAPPPERPRSRPAAKAFEDDFGGGLEDTPPSRGGDRSPDVSIFSLNPSESQSRYLDDLDDDAEPSVDVSTFGLNPSESQARYVDERDEAPRRSSSPPPPSSRVEFDDGDDFGAGIDESPSSRREYQSEREGSRSGSGQESAEGEQRRGRRRRGRGRGQGQGQDRGRSEQSRPPVESRREEQESREDLSFGGSFDEPPRRDEAEDVEVQESRYADVPTWAEAISLLVKSRPRTSSGSGDRGRSESSSESQERGERGGGNGGRGRGRGRRGGGGGGRRSD